MFEVMLVPAGPPKCLYITYSHLGGPAGTSRKLSKFPRGSAFPLVPRWSPLCPLVPSSWWVIVSSTILGGPGFSSDAIDNICIYRHYEFKVFFSHHRQVQGCILLWSNEHQLSFLHACKNLKRKWMLRSDLKRHGSSADHRFYMLVKFETQMILEIRFEKAQFVRRPPFLQAQFVRRPPFLHVSKILKRKWTSHETRRRNCTTHRGILRRMIPHKISDNFHIWKLK